MINQIIIILLFLIASIQSVSTFCGSASTDHTQFDFAVRLIQKGARSGRSTVLSPASISTSLFMIYLAADGETRQQLMKILGENATEIEIQRYFGKFLANVIGVKNNEYTLNIANRFCIRQGFSIKPSFPHILKFYYGERLHMFNYERKNQFAQEINSWISDKTNNIITESMRTTNINLETEILLFNAIYFEGIWKKQFLKKATRKSTFHISLNKKEKIPMMQLRAKLPYYDDNFVRIVKLPYIGNEIEMIIILPKKRFGLSEVRERMTGNDLFAYIRNANLIEVEIKLPKFKLKEELNLEDILKKFGIMDIFSKSANFKKLSDDPISVTNIIHNASFEIDENGTETSAEIGSDSSNDVPSEHFLVFNADQPFLYFIVKNLQTVLFAGQCGKFCSF